MKSEKEIRKHRDSLRKCLKQPCGCAGTLHDLECFIGMKMMIATIETLSWLLDENPELDKLVECYAKGGKTWEGRDDARHG